MYLDVGMVLDEFRFWPWYQKVLQWHDKAPVHSTEFVKFLQI